MISNLSKELSNTTSYLKLETYLEDGGVKKMFKSSNIKQMEQYDVDLSDSDNEDNKKRSTGGKQPSKKSKLDS